MVRRPLVVSSLLAARCSLLAARYSLLAASLLARSLPRYSLLAPAATSELRATSRERRGASSYLTTCVEATLFMVSLARMVMPRSLRVPSIVNS